MQLSDKYPFLANYFTKAITTSNKNLQSILFYGNDIDSQYTIAKEIARLLNCKENRDDDCDCINCRWVKEGTHPAVMTISRVDNKPDDDDSKTVISVKQSQLIKETLVTASEFHRVFIFCDRDDEGNLGGINPMNFQAETANSLLKIIEEPQPGVTFIFLTRYIDDVLPTIISRSQCFFVPAKEKKCDYSYENIKGIFTNYFEFERKDVFDISQSLQDLSKIVPTDVILDEIQNYMLSLLKENCKNVEIIKHITLVEEAKEQAKLNLKPINIFDDLCLKIIK